METKCDNNNSKLIFIHKSAFCKSENNGHIPRWFWRRHGLTWTGSVAELDDAKDCETLGSQHSLGIKSMTIIFSS